MEVKISRSKSLAISWIRIFATLSIVLSHYFQAFSFKWAWVLNVGVSVFLVLSGFLYGHKIIDKWGKWFYGRFTKLYIPLYIYSTIVLVLLKVFTDTPVSFYNFIKAGGVDSLGHLWFMKAIALCYILTPILQSLRRYSSVIFILLVIGGIIEYSYLQKSLFVFSWCWLYSIGYFFPSLSTKFQKAVQVVLCILVILLTINITWKDILDYNGAFNRCWHDIVGMFICICILPLIESICKHELPYIFRWIHNNSFFLYITHHPLLLGPLSIIVLFPNKYLGIFVSSVAIIFSTVLLGFVSKIVINNLNRVLK